MSIVRVGRDEAPDITIGGSREQALGLLNELKYINAYSNLLP